MSIVFTRAHCWTPENNCREFHQCEDSTDDFYFRSESSWSNNKVGVDDQNLSFFSAQRSFALDIVSFCTSSKYLDISDIFALEISLQDSFPFFYFLSSFERRQVVELFLTLSRSVTSNLSLCELQILIGKYLYQDISVSEQLSDKN